MLESIKRWFGSQEDPVVPIQSETLIKNPVGEKIKFSEIQELQKSIQEKEEQKNLAEIERWTTDVSVRLANIFLDKLKNGEKTEQAMVISGNWQSIPGMLVSFMRKTKDVILESFDEDDQPKITFTLIRNYPTVGDVEIKAHFDKSSDEDRHPVFVMNSNKEFSPVFSLTVSQVRQGAKW
jgi:hypothetical protein